MFRLPKPQKNYTEIPNVVFDEIFPRITNLAALKCYLILIRKTWGWQKAGDWLAISQLIKLTGLSRHSVIDGMRWLSEQGYIWTVKAGIPGCLLYTSDAADEEDSVDLGGRRIIKKK